MKRGRLAFLGIAGDHPGRVADQEGIGQATQEPKVKGRDHMHGHVLLVPKRFAVRVRTGADRGDGGRVGGLAGKNRIPHRVVDAGGLQVGGVKGFVGGRAVRPCGEAVHQRGGKVPRA